MPLKNVVAAERRMDLGSLFCLIGRHGPALLLAVAAVLSVFAGFLIYRSVRGRKRGKAGAAAPTQSRCPGAESDESPGESTDARDEGSSEIKEEAEVFQRDIEIRHRRSAAEKKDLCPSPPPPPPWISNIQVTDNNRTTSDDSLNLQDSTGDVQDDEDVCSLHDKSHEEEDKLLDSQTWDQDVSDETPRQEEEHCDSSHQVCLDQTPGTIHDAQQDHKATTGVESVIASDDGTSEEREDPDLTAPSSSSSSSSSSVEAEVQQDQNNELDVTPGDKDHQMGPMIKNESLEAPVIVAPAMAEEISRPHLLSCQPSVQTTDSEALGKSGDAAAPDTSENVTNPVTGEEETHVPSVHRERKSSRTDKNATFDENNAAVGVHEDEMPHPEVLPISQIEENHQVQPKEDLLNPPPCQIHFPPPNPNELSDHIIDAVWSPGVGDESGISSMAVSPDFPCDGYEFGHIDGEEMHPRMDCEEVREAEKRLLADDVVVSVTNEDGAEYQSLAGNEDTFGHEIEDSYHRALDFFMVQLSANSSNSADGLMKKKKASDEVEAEVQERRGGGGAAKKMEMEAEKEKEEEDVEKSEISIMEATMDNNEWITDGNYQVLPWMNLSVSPSFDPNQKKPDRIPSDVHHLDSSPSDSHSEAADSSEAAVEENTENQKKTVAVSPMPQTVNVTFGVHYVTDSPYQRVAVTGDRPELGRWKECVPLERLRDGRWAGVVGLPPESHVEWKFVVMEQGEVWRWEECGNRLLHTGAGEELTVQELWGLL